MEAAAAGNGKAIRTRTADGGLTIVLEAIGIGVRTLRVQGRLLERVFDVNSRDRNRSVGQRTRFHGKAVGLRARQMMQMTRYVQSGRCLGL